MVAVGHLTASRLSKLRRKMPVDPRAQRAGRHRAGLARDLGPPRRRIMVGIAWI
jgi:hypothetical protein